MRSVRLAPWTALAGLCFLAGCGGGPNLAEVEGTVKINGKPAPGIMVEFVPLAGAPGSIGETNSEGRYKLTPKTGKGSGALVGRHKVVLRDTAAMGDKFLGRAGESVDMTKGKKVRVTGKYTDATTTTIQKDVVPGTNDIPLEVP